MTSKRRLENIEEERHSTHGRKKGMTLADGLGWFSVALGLMEVAAPRQVARMIGVPEDEDSQSALRACGIRELVNGVAILANDKPTSFMWARVGGDIVDLALLSRAARSPGANRERVTAAAVAVAGVTVLDVMASQSLGRDGEQSGAWDSALRTLPHAESRLSDGSVRIKKAITIRRTPEEIYRYWRNLENLPNIMSHLASVQSRDSSTSHWEAKGAPGGITIEWDAEIIKDEPNSIIAWRSLPGADIQNAGSVRFKAAPGGRGTELVVDVYYRPPGGKAGKALVKLLGAVPEVQLLNDLRAFKQLMELGERAHSDASIHQGMHHPARPSRDATRLVTPENKSFERAAFRAGGVT
jgi:uncharacterized membrane protein